MLKTESEPTSPAPVPQAAKPATPPVPLPAPTTSVPRKKTNGFKGLVVAAAWIAMPLFGVVVLILTILLGIAIIGSYQSELDVARVLIVASLIGLFLLGLIVVGVWRARKYTFIRHALISLWVGIGLYTVLLGSAGATVGVLSFDQSGLSTNTNAQVCSTPLDQLKQSGDAVVPIQTDEGFGTGFSIDNKGTVLTAYHVIEDAREIYANYSTGVVPITILQVSPEDDLALLQMATPTENYFNLSTEYATGDEVLAYGYPGNALTAGPPSVSKGIISRALTTADLRMTDESFPDGFEIVQTDAAINPGNSGGPLIGACGVVGVINSISDSSQLSEYVGVVSEQGIGYAVSTKTAVQRFDLEISQPF